MTEIPDWAMRWMEHANNTDKAVWWITGLLVGDDEPDEGCWPPNMMQLCLDDCTDAQLWELACAVEVAHAHATEASTEKEAAARLAAFVAHGYMPPGRNPVDWVMLRGWAINVGAEA